MKNFFKRMGAFIFGMIFMLIVEIGAIIGFGWYAFSGLTLENLGVTNDGKLSNGIDLGEFSNYSIDKFIKYVSIAKDGNTEFTFETLKEQGFDIVETLKVLNVDVDSADPRDVQAFKEIDLVKLFESDPLQNIRFGAALTFLGKDENGKYAIFNDSVREILRNYNIGELFVTNAETNTLQLLEVLKTYKLGAVLSQTFVESFENDEYVYTAETPALELLGKLPIELIAKISATQTLDFGYEVNEGVLQEYGNMKLSEFIATLTCQTKENYEKTLSLYEDYTFKTLAEIFVKNEQNVYELKLDGILQDVKLGSLFSFYKCTNDANCKAHDNLSDCNGWWYSRIEDNDSVTYQMLDNATMNGIIMNNLYNFNLFSLLNGDFNVTALSDGVYLGYALGNQIKDNAGSDYCSVDCLHEGHVPNYLWVDSNSQDVSVLINEISNLSLQDAMEGQLDILGVFEDLKVGELMNLTYYNGAWCEKVKCDNSGSTCPAHKGLTACNGEYAYIQVESATLSGEINVNLYDLNVGQLLNGEFEISSLLKGAYLGKAFGYNPINKTGYCNVDCAHDGHDANYYWVDSSNQFVNELYNAISNVSLESAINGSVDIQSIINGVQIGSVLGNVYDNVNSKWTTIDGNDIVLNTVIDKILYNLYSFTISDLSSGNLQLEVLVGGIKIGEFIGYEYDVNENWWKKGNNKVSFLENKFASTYLTDLTSGSSLETILGDVYIYELVGHKQIVNKGESCLTSCPDKLHYHDTDGNLVNSVNSIINGVKLSEILNGNLHIETRINNLYLKDVVDCKGVPLLEALQDCQIKDMASKVYTLKVGDIVGINEKTSMGLLKVVKDKNIVNLENELLLVKLGYVFGYELVDDTWKAVTYNDCTSACPSDCDGIHKSYSDVSSLSLKLADITLGEFSNKGLDVSIFTLGDIYTKQQLESGIFNSLDKTKNGGGEYLVTEIPVSEIPERLANGLKNATCNDLIAYGIVSFDANTITALNNKFGSQTVWGEYTINQLLTNLLNFNT